MSSNTKPPLKKAYMMKDKIDPKNPSLSIRNRPKKLLRKKVK